MRLPTLYKQLFLSPEPGESGSTPATPDLPTVGDGDPAIGGGETASLAAEPAPKDEPAPDLSATLGDLLAKVGQPEEPPTPTPTPAPKEPAAKDTPSAPKDDDLTPPEGLNERASQRFAQLAERVKAVPELERRATEAEGQLGKVREMVNASGLQPNEFTDMLETGRLLKSSKPADLNAALERIDAIRTDLALKLGKDVPGADPLAAHPDLLADVSALNLTRERALEIVRLRGQGKAAEQLTAQQQEVAEFTKTVEAASASMEAALKARAAEPGHESKLKSIHAYFADPVKMQSFVRSYPPGLWPTQIQFMYDNMGVQAPVAAAPAGPQPLRPNNVRTGAPVRNGPVTAEGAVADAFKLVGM